MSNKERKKKLIYDVLYGFVELSPVEEEIISSVYYQRLRWIKQLGFSFYTYPGAEHSRFGHSIGVMYNSHCILKSIYKDSYDEELFSGNLSSKEVLEHQMIRLAALLHDLGTFPFSHTIENSYIKFAQTLNNSDKTHPDNHEHLGSFIIKRTPQEGGITFILKKHGIDPQRISDLVKGVDSNILANQVLHSEIDCDRMDYLLRDAHYTGLNYGAYDREYLLHHFDIQKIANQDILTIKDKAINCIQDFLFSRFAWYSQVVRSARGAKYDALAEEIAFYLLRVGKLWSYQDLLQMIESDPNVFFSFNDSYFLKTIHEIYITKPKGISPKIIDMIKALLFAESPVRIEHEAFKQRILDQNNRSENDKILKRTKDKFHELDEYVKKYGGSSDWVIEDLPKKDIYLVKSSRRVVKDKTQMNVLLERDPVKISDSEGAISLLSNFENNFVSKLQSSFNYIPHVFCSPSAYELLKKNILK